jgi:MarR family transcriptional regulator, organic hydroperoxide resistance regulator
MSDYTRKYGPAAIGARLRRLSESIDEDAGLIYVELGIRFQQRWVGILEELSKRGPRSVGEIADALGIRHSSVSQTRRSLEEARLIESETHPDDARSRKLSLSATGKQLVRKLESLWAILNATSIELDEEAGHVVAALDRLDAALSRESLYERVRAKLEASGKIAPQLPARAHVSKVKAHRKPR